jgi:hypothetical protein
MNSMVVDQLTGLLMLLSLLAFLVVVVWLLLGFFFPPLRRLIYGNQGKEFTVGWTTTTVKE